MFLPRICLMVRTNVYECDKAAGLRADCCGLFMGSQVTLGSGVMQSPRGPSWAGSHPCEGSPSQVRVLFCF